MNRINLFRNLPVTTKHFALRHIAGTRQLWIPLPGARPIFDNNHQHAGIRRALDRLFGRRRMLQRKT